MLTVLPPSAAEDGDDHGVLLGVADRLHAVLVQHLHVRHVAHMDGAVALYCQLDVLDLLHGCATGCR